MSHAIVYNALLADSDMPETGYVCFAGGKITRRGTGLAPQELIDGADTATDARGAYLIPGLTDTHVHFREPGLEHKATIYTESIAAAAGGITAVFDMPNTKPATTTPEALAAKEALARKGGLHTRYRALLGIVPGGLDGLRTIDPATIPAVKLFLGTSTGAMASPEGRELDELFRYCASVGLPIIVHAEDNGIIAANTAAAIARYGSPEKVPVSLHHEIRSREACLRSSAHAVELAMRFGTRLHIAHVSTADEVRELLASGNTADKLITAETTPMYLDPVLANAAARSSLHKINPAIKTEADAEALRKALADGAIDTIGTDHAPHLIGEKTLSGITAASGAPSVQFALQLMLTYLPLALVVRKMTAGPAAVFGIDTPVSLAEGQNADMSLLRPVAPYTISDADVLSKCAWTPFAGRAISHRIEKVWVGGTTVFADGKAAGCARHNAINVTRTCSRQ